MTRKDYGSGSIYLRASDGRYVGAIDHGTNANGKRRRITVTGKTEGEVKRKLRDKRRAIERGESPMSSRATVRTWAIEWLRHKQRTLRPKAYRAAASPVTKWIIPTIGHRRLSDLTARDIRAVADAQRNAGLKTSTAAATHRVLLNMLRDATREGHPVPPRVLLTKGPQVPKSDRQPLTIPEAIACLAVAGELPHGTRWLFALLHGMRSGECRGVTWDAIDLDAGTLVVEWQLQRLTYRDPTDKSAGFRVPEHLEVRHLYKAFHLTRPKSSAGFRVIPLLPGVVEALQRWREIAPENPWGLVWPTADGRPASLDDDLEEWHAIQGTAAIGHPDGRYYHVHECRNVTATQLGEVGADPLVITSLLGHSDISTSRAYMKANLEPKREALEKVAGILGLG